MAIYTRMGAPVQIVEAELRKRWWMMKRGRTWTFDIKPTAAQLKGAKETDEFDIWWVKAIQTGAYPDGSGVNSIGKFLEGPEDKTKRGFVDEIFFCADNGIRELHDEFEIKADDRSRRIIEERRAITGIQS